MPFGGAVWVRCGCHFATPAGPTVPPAGLEPATPALEGPRSCPLSYEGALRSTAYLPPRQDSNLRLADP